MQLFFLSFSAPILGGHEKGRYRPRLLMIMLHKLAEFADSNFQFIHVRQDYDAQVTWTRPIEGTALY
ncbi:MAG: hypothetical protein HNEKOMLI_00058 [Sodalis sp. Psp]|nr:hypothetical protein [Sodalis sp. Psp]MCR3756565.1 hypothetical protein [Sodalis sp. Ppy]